MLSFFYYRLAYIFYCFGLVITVKHTPRRKGELRYKQHIYIIRVTRGIFVRVNTRLG